MKKNNRFIEYFKYETSEKSMWKVLLYLLVFLVVQTLMSIGLDKLINISGVKDGMTKSTASNISIVNIIIAQVLSYFVIIVMDKKSFQSKERKLRLAAEELVNSDTDLIDVDSVDEIIAKNKAKSNYLFDKGLAKKPFSFKFFSKLFILVVSLNVCFNYLFSIYGDVIEKGETIKRVEEMLNNANPLLLLSLIVVVAPIFEEILFRKIICVGLLKKGKSPVFAIVMSALLFALIHFNIHQGILAFILGLLFACVIYRTGKLVYTILMHFVFNFTTLFSSALFHLEKGETMPVGKTFVFIGAIVLVVVFGFIVYKADELKKVKPNLD